MFEGFEGVHTVPDDILIHGSKEVEHDTRVLNALQIVKKNNLELNKYKCKFKKEEIPYVGHVLFSSVLRCDPEKVRAILDMLKPKNVKDLQYSKT